jgi:hypothetical protein
MSAVSGVTVRDTCNAMMAGRIQAGIYSRKLPGTGNVSKNDLALVGECEKLPVKVRPLTDPGRMKISPGDA